MPLLVIGFFTAGAQDTMVWRSGVPLNWSNFRGQPDLSSDHAAYTHSSIAYHYSARDTVFLFKVQATFDPKLSWKKPAANDATLVHEQGHFDITELFARQLRATFRTIKPGLNLDGLVQRIVSEAINEKDKIQLRYDAETNNGNDSAAQLAWNGEIARLLQENQ